MAADDLRKLYMFVFRNKPALTSCTVCCVGGGGGGGRWQ